MGYISHGQGVVAEKLLEEGNTTGVLGVNISISPDKYDWVRVLFIQLINANPQPCKFRNKLRVPPMGR